MTASIHRLPQREVEPFERRHGDYRDYLYRHGKPLAKVERSRPKAGELVMVTNGWERVDG